MATKKRKIGPQLLPKSQTLQSYDFYLATREINELATVAAGLLPFIRRVVPNDPCDGGFVCVRTVHLSDELVFAVGALKSDKISGRYRRAIEKADRLRNHLRDGHLTSYESRDPDQDRWGGAIVTGRKGRRRGRLILSFSGFPELADEAFMLLLAVYTHVMTIKHARRIAAINHNPYFEPALEGLLAAA